MAVKVLIVDDSAFMRQLIKRILESDSEIEVVGIAADGFDALKKIDFYKPQVVTLDLRMPRMDGLTCLARIMAKNPLPVVIISALTTKDAEETFRALELGAVDFITKPGLEPSEDLWQLKDEIIQKVKTAALANLERLKEIPGEKAESISKFPQYDYELLGIGASTGGPRAIQFILTHLPPDFPLGIVVAQHMPGEFIKIFAARLNSLGPFPVKVAEDGEPVEPGTVLIAPYGYQTGVVKNGAESRIRLETGDYLYRPSIDYLFTSMAETFKNKAISVLLTGMGADGAKGLLNQRQLGARTIAEAEESCVIYGMPRVAAELGAAEFVTPLAKIPNLICSLVSGEK